jgi:hypothetical protein
MMSRWITCYSNPSDPDEVQYHILSKRQKKNHSLTWAQLDCQGADREAERQRD